MDRTILHVDMNSFYASVEQAEDHDLRGKPIVVGGCEEKRHGIVLTKSIESKPYGIKTAETLWSARRKCPHLIVLPPRFDLYKRYSRLSHNIYYSYTNLVEPFGIDECWIDLTGSPHLKRGSAMMIAREISLRIKTELGITASIGIGWDKITAKFGSDYKKPDAITSITRDNYKDIFWGAPVRDLLYVGRATEKKLYGGAILTIGELANASDRYLKRILGVNGIMIGSFARGEDVTPVKSFNLCKGDVDRSIKSFGNGMTAPHDITTETDAKALVYLLAESVAQRLREGGFRTRCVDIAVRDANDLSSYTRQCSLCDSTASTKTIAKTAWQLLIDHQPLDTDHPIRGLSVRVTSLSPVHGNRQLSLLGDQAQEDLDFAIDALRRRFGTKRVVRGIELMDESLIAREIKDEHTVHPIGFLHR